MLLLAVCHNLRIALVVDLGLELSRLDDVLVAWQETLACADALLACSAERAKDKLERAVRLGVGEDGVGDDSGVDVRVDDTWRPYEGQKRSVSLSPCLHGATEQRKRGAYPS